MNRNLLLTILPLLIILSSCSKKSDPVKPDDKSQKLYSVIFNVSGGFTNDTHVISSAAKSVVNNQSSVTSDSLKKYVSKLEYLVYDSLGKLVKDSIQTNVYEDFGVIKMQLQAGNYRVHMIGSTGAVNIGNLSSGPTVFISPSKGIMDDWFRKSIDLKVTADPVQSQSMVMERVLGKIEVHIADAIPSAITKVSAIYNQREIFYLNTVPYESTPIQRQIDVVAKTGTTNTTLSDFVIPGSNGTVITDVTLRAYNSAGAIVYEKIIPNITLERNKLTILTGNLFTTTPANNSLAVGISGGWNAPTSINF